MTEYRGIQVRRNMTLAERLAFHSSPANANGCVLWKGKPNSHGYGTLSWEGRMLKAPRVAWECTNGPIPDGMHVCHHCDVRTCVNVDHLFLGTIADMVAKDRHVVPLGTANGNSKLTAEQVAAIRADPRPHRAIAKDYGMKHAGIGSIKRRETWKHI